MDERIYNIRISPEFITSDIFSINYTGDSYNDDFEVEICCDIITSAVTKHYTGQTFVYSSMTEILSGGTYNTGTTQYDSLLTGLTIPIFISETCIDIGYYSTFDGAVLQKDVMNNFLFSSTTLNPYEYFFYNTSDTQSLGYLQFSDYKVDWGDGISQTITNFSPNYYAHTYAQSGDYTISMSGMSPWGYNIIKKDISVPYSAATITNPNGTAYFVPAGGNWSATPIMYDYIFSGDSNCDLEVYDVSSSPIIVTGYTTSNINGLEVYGKKVDLYAGKFIPGVPVTGASGNIGIFYEPNPVNPYTAYTINDIDYYDYEDGRTIFIVESSGITSDMIVCSGLTKNEVLLNVIDEAEVQSDVFIDRGKVSAYERVQRLNEIDNIGELETYGYKFYNIVKN
jgi:hypothetical protein